MKVLLTGAQGFLGWHTRCLMFATTDHEVVPVSRSSWDRLGELVGDVDAVIHVAGVNRGSDETVRDGNLDLARDLAEALGAAGRPVDVVYANSVQAGNGTPYGDGKEGAGELLAAAVAEAGGSFSDVRLPNLFGEHGAPKYNSFVATFIAAVIAGESPSIEDRPIGLMHVQTAAQVLVDALDTPVARIDPEPTATSVLDVWRHLERFHATYVPSGDVPAIGSRLEADLFNSYRAALFPEHYPIALVPHSDDRGRLVETVRTHGNGGQTFTSTTVPGVTRGQHFHLRKLERFVVLEGEAEIKLRKMFTDEVLVFPVSGRQPVAIDMPTMWLHNITNVGDTTLTTLFWTDSLFDPEDPDTFYQPVEEPQP